MGSEVIADLDTILGALRVECSCLNGSTEGSLPVLPLLLNRLAAMSFITPTFVEHSNGTSKPHRPRPT